MSKQIVIGSSKSMKFAYQTESQPIHWPIVFRVRLVCISSRFKKKHVDSKIAPKTQALVIIDMLFYRNNACMSHWTFKSIFLCTVFLIEVFILFTTKPCSTHTKCDWSLYCLVCVWYANFTEIEDPIVVFIMIVLWNFRLLAEAKCHTVWKMIVSLISY